MFSIGDACKIGLEEVIKSVAKRPESTAAAKDLQTFLSVNFEERLGSIALFTGAMIAIDPKVMKYFIQAGQAFADQTDLLTRIDALTDADAKKDPVAV